MRQILNVSNKHGIYEIIIIDGFTQTKPRKNNFCIHSWGKFILCTMPFRCMHMRVSIYVQSCRTHKTGDCRVTHFRVK